MMANKTSKWESSLSNGVRGVAFIDFNCGTNVYKTSQSAIAPAKNGQNRKMVGLR